MKRTAKISTSPSGTTQAVAAHAAEHVGRFRRQWGPGPTAALAAGLTAQQQRPEPNWSACDQLWAYHAMAYLRSVGRERPTGRIPRSSGGWPAIARSATIIMQDMANEARRGRQGPSIAYYCYGYAWPAAARQLAARPAPWSSGWLQYVDAAAVRSLTWGE